MKKLLLIAFSTIFLASCASLSSSFFVDTNIQKLELGMSRTEAIAIMGNAYKTITAEKTSEGDLHIIGYRLNSYDVYLLYFIDEKLDKWESVYMPSTTVTNSYNENNRNRH